MVKRPWTAMPGMVGRPAGAWVPTAAGVIGLMPFIKPLKRINPKRATLTQFGLKA